MQTHQHHSVTFTMSRRQTLGGLSPAQVNARASFAPTRMVKDGKGASTKAGAGVNGRLSLAPSSLRPGDHCTYECNHSLFFNHIGSCWPLQPHQAFSPLPLQATVGQATAACPSSLASVAPAPLAKSPWAASRTPAPSATRGYQQNCARLLIQYLSTHSYEHPVSLKTLASPMSKDVSNIMQVGEPVLLSRHYHLPC